MITTNLTHPLIYSYVREKKTGIIRQCGMPIALSYKGTERTKLRIKSIDSHGDYDGFYTVGLNLKAYYGQWNENFMKKPIKELDKYAYVYYVDNGNIYPDMMLERKDDWLKQVMECILQWEHRGHEAFYTIGTELDENNKAMWRQP